MPSRYLVLLHGKGRGCQGMGRACNADLERSTSMLSGFQRGVKRLRNCALGDTRPFGRQWLVEDRGVPYRHGAQYPSCAIVVLSGALNRGSRQAVFACGGENTGCPILSRFSERVGKRGAIRPAFLPVCRESRSTSHHPAVCARDQQTADALHRVSGSCYALR
jgi:hypothetical protein